MADQEYKPLTKDELALVEAGSDCFGPPAVAEIRATREALKQSRRLATAGRSAGATRKRNQIFTSIIQCANTALGADE